MKEDLLKNLGKILSELGVKDPVVVLTVPVHRDKGDYSTNVAMSYAKQLGMSPLTLAEEIKNKLEVKNILSEVATPGFLNFFFDKKYYVENLNKILEEGEKFGENQNLEGKKFFIEHTQPNPFKIFHIGHLMNNSIGESISRIIKKSGAEVQTATYHGDKGLHVAKAVWSLKKGTPLKDAYAEGHKAFEEDEKAKEEIIEINKKLYDESDIDLNEIYEKGRGQSLSFFEEMYERLDSHFDYHFFESEAGEVGKDLVLKNTPKVFEVGEEGAVIFKGENFEPKTHTRVFLTKDKLPTYEAKELGLAEIKKDFFDYDTSITITANEQDSFFKVVEVAIGEVFPELKGKLHHLSHGLLKLSTGKMSSREGNIISAEDLINQVKEKVLTKSSDSSIARSSETGFREKIIDDETAEIIALGAIKYTILRSNIGGDIIFDFDKSISFEGDSGPYLQYATVRAKSVLTKSKSMLPKSDFGKVEVPEGWETTNIERLLERFSGVVERASLEYAPHYITTYLTELAGEFNSFYASHKIIDEEDKTSSYRLAITKAFVQVMTNGLDLLAIKVPEKM